MWDLKSLQRVVRLSSNCLIILIHNSMGRDTQSSRGWCLKLQRASITSFASTKRVCVGMCVSTLTNLCINMCAPTHEGVCVCVCVCERWFSSRAVALPKGGQIERRKSKGPAREKPSCSNPLTMNYACWSIALRQTTKKFPTCQKKMDSTSPNEAEGRWGEGATHTVCLRIF